MGQVVEKARAAIAKVEALGDKARRIFTEFTPDRIVAAAEEAERLIAACAQPLPLAGMLVSAKDLYDEKGLRTTAASRLLADREPAAADSEVVKRIKAAGAVMFGRTTLSEFAYSGVGLNPHFGTPGNVFDETAIPGGSTSGGALTVALGICDVALGTDTGGSVRIPAAANGIYGFKPTQSTVPLDGVHPLSKTLDSAGPLAHDLDTVIKAYAVMRGDDGSQDAPALTPPLKLAIPTNVFIDDLDSKVAADWKAALAALAAAGHELVDVEVPFLDQAGRAIGMIISTEACAQYGKDFGKLETIGDPNVLRRMRFAEMLSREDVAAAYRARDMLVARFSEAMSGFDALVAPTLRITPPKISEVEIDFDRLNPAMLRNTSMINAVDGCALTIPTASAVGPFPGALMLAHAKGLDWHVLRAAEALSDCFPGINQ